MVAKSRSYTAEAFLFRADWDDRTTERWFNDAIDRGAITVERYIEHGTAKISGFTVHDGRRGDMRGRCGDYVVRFPGGRILPVEPTLFLAMFNS